MSELQIITSDPALSKLRNVTANEWERFAQVEEKQRKLHAWLTSENTVSDEEHRAITCRTYADAVAFLTDLCSLAQERSWKKNQKGWRRWSREYQNLSLGALSFMEDIRPLLQVVEDVGGPYSGLALGTITALFSIAAQKINMEEHISSALEGVKDRLPALAMYQEIYGYDNEIETDLQKRILLAYLAFMDLAIEIVKYYVGPSHRRWSVALFKPSKFTDLTDEIFGLLSGIRQRCDELLSLSVGKIKALNEQQKVDMEQQKVDMDQLKVMNKELQATIDDLLLNGDSRDLKEMLDLLGLGSRTPETLRQELRDYGHRLSFEQQDEANYEQMNTAGITRLRNETDLVKWDTPGLSRLLVLVGLNNNNISYGKRHNWISPFALDLAGRLDSASCSVPYGAYSFYPGVHPHGGKKTGRPAPISMHTCLPVILTQLLRLRRAQVSDSGGAPRTALMAAIQKYVDLPVPEEDDDDGGRKDDGLADLALQVMSLYGEKETVYLILDRIDHCAERDQYELARILVRMMVSSRCVVKILLVADSMGWIPGPKDYGYRALSQICEVKLTQGMLYDEGY